MSNRQPMKDHAFFYMWRLQGLRELVAELGYTLATHGSYTYDLDCVAVPWTDEAVDARTLVTEVGNFVGSDPKALAAQEGTKKPHGRLTWTISMGGRFHLDFSVMPRSEDT